MIFPWQTGKEDDSVSRRTGMRIRMIAAAACIVAAVIGGVVWLGSSVDLGSAALSTVEVRETAAPAQDSKPEEDSRKDVEPDAHDEEPIAEAPQDEPVQEAPTQDTPTAEMPSRESSQESIGIQEQTSSTELSSEDTPQQTHETQSQQQTQSQTKTQTQSPTQVRQQTSQQNSQGTPTSRTQPTQPTTQTSDPQPAQPQSLSVTVSVDGSAAGQTSWSTSLMLDQGATVYDALLAADNNINARSTGYGIYVVAIDGLAEKDHGSQSGWMYAVNGIYPNTACSNYVLRSGDSITWVYVNVEY